MPPAPHTEILIRHPSSGEKESADQKSGNTRLSALLAPRLANFHHPDYNRSMILPPQELLLIAGAGQYPLHVAQGARAAGVKRIDVLALRGQASRAIGRFADNVRRVGVGEVQRALDWILARGIRDVMLVGQIHPTALFTTRFDARAAAIMRSLPIKSAHSIFGATITLLEAQGLRVLPASTYMDRFLPEAGVLTRRAPDAREAADITRGEQAALAIGVVDVGQTVVVKNGMILAVEAFEGTNAAIRRGGRLGGAGAVVVKVAREGHDMRFDIPVVGARTIQVLRRIGASTLAFQARRTILFDREAVIAAAERNGLSIIAFDSGLPAAPTRPPEVEPRS